MIKSLKPPTNAKSNTLIEFVYIPAPRGERYKQYSVSTQTTEIKPFWMAITPITVGQWGSFSAIKQNSHGKDPRLPRESIENHEAEKYCNEMKQSIGTTIRLPTMDEWQWAALGGEDFNGSGCTNFDKIAWYSSNSQNRTQPVGLKKPNNYGLYDMTGNVAQWTSSWCTEENGFWYGGDPYWIPREHLKVRNCRATDQEHKLEFEYVGFRPIWVP